MLVTRLRRQMCKDPCGQEYGKYERLGEGKSVQFELVKESRVNGKLEKHFKARS